MDDSEILSADRVAACNLLTNLQQETTPITVELVARHFARHRQTAME